ncbi:tetratricopeptide repeat protein [Roseivirga pacifica]|uniref:Tetratricopeptide repeat-containing protein n=1 Tax=Roseivirga pacifica TaxID=1267423 RepID=A0A1I0MNE9_9BACT|nr:tetratricopeptide repeat protein [Roseivirga pacifica]MCO6359089.1 tetratricopeptide repeat protein [Roseivirga pacifica]MCO6365275.1 tetratricopeptide repeat protein [Roseivirga pacifica]MCO6371995.1 tetratricopeptide repeat protein [Roseivirga pacifica]MCO6375894.1 tetratricopeptide repeat protein [Roseivirga pacifica]MCO6379373.1 tetratricopeptide repeat protein [Roseivirga pacifica]
MAENTSSEEQKPKGGSAIDKFKNEVGPIGFIGAIVGLVVLVGASVIFFLNFRNDQRNEDAQNEIFQAQYYYEKDSLEFALDGDGRNLGFLQIIDIYGGTEVANLAHYYAGASYLKMRNYQEAVNYLEDFSTSEVIVQARAQKLLGDAYMELGNYSTAGDTYTKAANTVDDQYFSPGYLLSASLAYEKASDFDNAIEACETVIEKYKQAAEIKTARKHKARLEALAGR